MPGLDLVPHTGKPAEPRPEDELIGLPYIDAISPEEKAVVDALIREEVRKLRRA